MFAFACAGNLISRLPDMLTVLQNVRAAVVSENKDTIEYECCLYQLKDDSYEFRNVEDLLNSKQDASNEHLTFSQDWKPIKNRVLRPETSAVVVMKMKLNRTLDPIASGLQWHCLLLYYMSDETLNRVSSQQYFVRTIEIDTNILCSPECQVTFDPRTMYKDLLAICATSRLFRWTVEHKSDSIVQELSTCLIDTFGFSRFVAEEKMDVDANFSTIFSSHDIAREATPNGISEMFYQQSTGHNHLMGTLIRVESQPNKLLLKVYARDDYKALYIYKQLCRELEAEYTIRPLSYDADDWCHKANLLNFHESLQKEVEIAISNLELASRSGKMKPRSKLLDLQMKLYTQEMSTDCILKDLNNS